MIGRLKIFLLVCTLIIGGAAASVSMGGDEGEYKHGEGGNAVYAVHLKEVEAYYDHEVFLLISSEDGSPVWGTVEILPSKLPLREKREDDRVAKAIKYELEEKEEESEDEEVDEESTPNEEEEDEEENEEQQDRENQEREHEEDRDRDEHGPRVEEERHRRQYWSEFKYRSGEGKLLLFPSSHRYLGFTAIVTVHGKGEVTVTPFIFVKDTEVYVFPDSKDDEGKYCEIERVKDCVRYGFEDFMDSPDFECDWDYDDVVLCVGRVPKKEKPCKDGRVYTLSVRWGQLDGNEGHEEMIPWDGSIFVGDGAVVLIEPLLFDYEGDYNDGGDDLIFEQVSRNEIQWRASTTVHWDGILVLIIVPEGHRETHVTVHTEQWSGVFNEDDLPDLHKRFEINDHEDEIEINGWRGKVGPDHHEKNGEEHESKKGK